MTLFTRLPITVAGSLPVIPYKYIGDAAYEADAYDHWVFDEGGPGGLVGRVNGRTLAAQSAAPTYSDTFLTLPTETGKALLSPKVDGREQTLCIVYKYIATAGVKVLAGTRGATGTPGSLLFSTGGQIYANQSPSFQTGPVAESVNAWMFVAYSESALLGTTSAVVFKGGVGAVTQTGGVLKTVSSNLVALGNGYSAGGPVATQSFAEFIHFDRGLTAAELVDVYARSKLRMADRGITVV